MTSAEVSQTNSQNSFRAKTSTRRKVVRVTITGKTLMKADKAQPDRFTNMSNQVSNSIYRRRSISFSRAQTMVAKMKKMCYKALGKLMRAKII